MRIAVWKNPVTEPMLLCLKQAFGDGVYSAGREDVLRDVKDGLVDVALIPSDAALASPNDVDILPAVAVSTWNNPFGILTVGQQLGTRTLGLMHAREGSLSALIAAIVLKEHYGTVVALNEREVLPGNLSPHALISVPLDEEIETPADEAITMDLSQEWYELTNYPFVWALFVASKGSADPSKIQMIRDVVVQMDENRAQFAQSWSDNPEMESFFLNDFRIRLDDLSVASLTELADHLFFYGLTEEIQPVMFASLPVDDDSSTETGPNQLDI